MPTNLYQRTVRVTANVPVATPGDYNHVTSDQIVINGGDDPSQPGLRIQFDIALTDQKEPNCSKVIITNLSGTRRSSLQQKGVKILVEAGYLGTGRTRIFRGDVRSTDHIRSGPDWDTTMQIGDGERAFRYGRVAESFAPGTPASQVLRYMANASGLQIGNIDDAAAATTQVFDQGYVVHGAWQKSMDRLCKSLDLGWSIQAETLQVLSPNGSLQAQIPLISPSTGLIGSPQMGTPEKKSGTQLLKFKALLQPTRPSARVHLKSERYDADVIVKKCRFVGDTHGDEWYTEIEGSIVKGGK